MEVGDVWELFAEDGQMKMYKREEEVDGMVMDPLKALHEVRGNYISKMVNIFPGYYFKEINNDKVIKIDNI